jgi:GNAT superfamily N-acetyltransferase
MIQAPLVDAGPRELNVAVQDNLVALFRSMCAVLPGSEIVEQPHLSRHCAFPTNPMFKGVWGTNLAPDDVDAAVDESIAWFKERGAPYFFWWTAPGTAPNDLGDRLAARGLMSMAEQQKELASGIRQTEAGAPGMVADLHHMNEAVLETAPAGFSIEEVADRQSLEEFKHVFVTTYEIPEWAGQAWVDATLAVGIGKTPWRMFVGRINGEPVATNMLFNGGGVASVYAVAAIPSVRGRGIGGAITLAPLLQARADGYRYAVLFSTEVGVRVYERIGFRMTDVRINRYLWRNA